MIPRSAAIRLPPAGADTQTHWPAELMEPKENEGGGYKRREPPAQLKMHNNHLKELGLLLTTSAQLDPAAGVEP